MIVCNVFDNFIRVGRLDFNLKFTWDVLAEEMIEFVHHNGVVVLALSGCGIFLAIYYAYVRITVAEFINTLFFEQFANYTCKLVQ